MEKVNFSISSNINQTAPCNKKEQKALNKETNTFKISNELNSLAFCGKSQVISPYQRKMKEKEALDKYLHIGNTSSIEEIKELLENEFLQEPQRASLEKTLEERLEEGGLDNPYKVVLSDKKDTKATVIRAYDKNEHKMRYYEIVDSSINDTSSDEKGDNLALRSHAESPYSAFMKELQFNGEEKKEKIKQEYLDKKDEKYGDGGILCLLDKCSIHKIGLDENKTLGELFNSKEEYLDAVLNKAEDILAEEKEILSSYSPCKDEHVFYRGLGYSPVIPEIVKLHKEIDTWSDGDVVVPHFNPMFVTSDAKTAEFYLKENQNHKNVLFRIKTPKGAKFGYTKGAGSECILPSKAKFRCFGKVNKGNLEIVNLEYLPE